MAETKVARYEGKPKGLTLADLTVVRNVGAEPQRYTGAEIAQVLDATRHRPDGTEWEPYTSSASITLELDGLAAVVGAISAAEHEGQDCQEALGYLMQQLRRLSQRVSALEPGENATAGWYAVQTKRARA